MKTEMVETSYFEAAQTWIAANPGLAMIAGAVALMFVCLDRETRRAFLPF